MLSEKDNQLLTRVGPGTAMGDLMRRYWLPFYLSADLESDAPPKRVRLLGENLLIFRSTSGEVGLVSDYCPHRTASLFFGRNEEDGLRCVYHGWKFAVDGSCTDMPNEPSDSKFINKVRLTAYPTRERGSVIWTYMGPLAEQPELPNWEWAELPETHVYLSMRIAESNFMQPIEGEYDSSHAPILHNGLPNPQVAIGSERPLSSIRNRNQPPVFDVVEADYGLLIGARYNADDANFYWRLYPFLMPFYTLVNVNAVSSSMFVYRGHAWVPMDDEHTICLCFSWNPTAPLTEEDIHYARHGLGEGRDGLRIQGLHPTVDVFEPAESNLTRPYAQYWPKLNKWNDYKIDYEAQKNTRFSGIPGLWPQDSGVQESMGSIAQRWKEHLGAADKGQIFIRRRMLAAARALRRSNTPPPAANRPDLYYMRSYQAILPRDVDWVKGTEEGLRAGQSPVPLTLKAQ